VWSQQHERKEHPLSDTFADKIAADIKAVARGAERQSYTAYSATLELILFALGQHFDDKVAQSFLQGAMWAKLERERLAGRAGP
jgi:hypothetical protein